MSHYKPYPAYKDSGVEWLGKVPEHWSTVPLKRLAVIQNGKDYKDVEIIEGGFPVIGSGGEFARSSQYMYNGESVLLGRKGTIDRPLYINGAFWTVDTMYYTVIGPKTVAKYFYYCALTIQFDKYSTNTALPSMTQEVLSQIPFAVPDVKDQRSIADHLDLETTRIDALITKKTRFIELLREKRQALITHTVTKGLDPTVKMKDSGVEWLGEVPEHWDVKPIKYLAVQINSGKTPSGGAEVYQESGVLFLRSQNVYDDGLRLEDVAYISAEIDAEMKWSRVFQNDVLLNITGASIGRSCIAPEGIPAANVNQHVCIVRIPEVDLARWISICFVSEAIKAQIDFSQNGAGREGLNFEQIGNMIVALPPSCERVAIMTKVDAETTRIDTLINKTERSIELLKERRSALITAAVTGQIDLREAA